MINYWFYTSIVVKKQEQNLPCLNFSQAKIEKEVT